MILVERRPRIQDVDGLPWRFFYQLRMLWRRSPAQEADSSRVAASAMPARAKRTSARVRADRITSVRRLVEASSLSRSSHVPVYVPVSPMSPWAPKPGRSTNSGPSGPDNILLRFHPYNQTSRKLNHLPSSYDERSRHQTGSRRCRPISHDALPSVTAE